MRTLTISDQGLLAPKVSAPPPITSTAAMWWASDLAVADGDPVSSWADRVNSVTVSNSGSNRPTMDADGAGGRPGVRFQRSSTQYLVSNAQLSSALSGCVVAVVAFTGGHASTIQVVAGAGFSGGNTRFNRFSNSGSTEKARLYQRNNDTAGVVSGGTNLGTSLRTIEWSSNGSAWTIRVNGTAETLSVDSDSNNGDWFGDTDLVDRFAIGAEVASALLFPFDGTLAYLGVFNAELSTDDRSALYAWISSYYGI